MIIDKNRKIIFVRHQKTASSSIINALKLNPNGGHKTHENLTKHICSKTGKNYIDGHHVPYFELKNVYPEVYENKSDYFKFAFTRNPWDRIVSAWKFAFEGGRLKQYDKVPFHKVIKKYLDAWSCVEMNTLDFCDGCDFIGKFENLQEDFNIVCDKIGIPRQELPHKNKTKHKHYTEYYDDETREIVAEKYAKDIEYFGYKFGE
jgi:hypothetical protein